MPHLPPYSLRNPTYAAVTAGAVVVVVMYLHHRHAVVKRRRAGFEDDGSRGPEYFKIFAGTCGVAYLLSRFLGASGAPRPMMGGGESGADGHAAEPRPTIEDVMRYIDNGDPDF